MNYHDFWFPLTTVYDVGEARAVARLVMERRFGFQLTDIACGAVETLDERLLTDLRSRLLTGEPVQYVLGVETFCDRTFHVEPGVLIPRPETEWLCQKAVELLQGKDTACVLDIGTGSGCIACTIALETSVSVTAWDVSDRAIAVARENAVALGANVRVEKQDALCPPADDRRWDIIVSNPPYVCENERSAMQPNVLLHEPGFALFVPDDDPLLFYRAITNYAVHAMKPDGTLLLEINPLFARELCKLLSATGFSSVQTANDLFGKERFAIASAYEVKRL